MEYDVQTTLRAIGERIVSLAANDDVVNSHLLLLAPGLVGPIGTANHLPDQRHDGSQNGHSGTTALLNEANVVLHQIEERSLLKAEGCQWAAERIRLKEEGADHQIDIAPRDRHILAKAREVPDCDLWMNRPDSPVPNDPSQLEVVGGCFQALGEATAIARLVETDLSGNRYLRAESLQLLAEAQSALRSAIQHIDGRTDPDQILVYRWVIENAQKRHLFIERYLHSDDPADPQRWPDLRARIQVLRERVEDELHLTQRRGRLFCKLRYQLVQASDAGTGIEPEFWSGIARTLDELVRNGVAPSSREIRDLLEPHLGEPPHLEDPPQGYVLVLRELNRVRGSSNDAKVLEGDCGTAEVAIARALLGDKRLVLIGGDSRPARKEAIERAFKLKELIWVETRPRQSVNSFAPYVARPDVAAVMLAIRWASHGFVEVRRFCDRYEKPLVWLPGGYGVNQIALHILAQCSDQLRRQALNKEEER